jgi:CRISPR/Cas system CMR subunit Cmr4 (Cas7 group RAMP superfamily)
MSKHIFVATPAFNNKVNTEFALSLIALNILLKENGVSITNTLNSSGSLLVAERNRIVEDFYRSEATHLLCVDSDLGFPAEAVLAMLNADKEFIAGVYPARSEDKTNEYLIRPKLTDKSTIVQEGHLLAAEYIPAGFMLLSRSAVQKMRDKFPELYYQPRLEERKDQHAYLFFNTEVYEGEFWGEDYVFCRRAREAGIDIWVDPLIEFDHDGKIGMLFEHMKENNMIKTLENQDTK